MSPPSETAINHFISQTSSTRDRALLYLTATGGNVDQAVASFKRKPHEVLRAGHSPPASKFSHPLAKDAISDDEGHDEGGDELPSQTHDHFLRPRAKVRTYSSSKKRGDHFTPSPRTTTRRFIIPIPHTRPSVERQSSVEYEPAVTQSSSTQSRSKQTKANTSGMANPGTGSTGLLPNPSGTRWFPTFSPSASRLDTGRMTTNTGNLQDPSERILQPSSHRSSFEIVSPVAIKSESYDDVETDQNQRDDSEIPPQVFSNRKKTKTGIPPKDPSSISLSKHSFRNAMNLAREENKWLIINLQSATVPACEVLNREIWRHPEVAAIISQSFLLFQLDHNDDRADVYLEKYCSRFDLDPGEVEIKQEDVEVKLEDVEPELEDVEPKKKGKSTGRAVQAGNRRIVKLPHIAILDPISEERWKLWNGLEVLDKDLFLADLSEYANMGGGGWGDNIGEGGWNE